MILAKKIRLYPTEEQKQKEIDQIADALKVV